MANPDDRVGRIEAMDAVHGLRDTMAAYRAVEALAPSAEPQNVHALVRVVNHVLSNNLAKVEAAVNALAPPPPKAPSKRRRTPP